MYGSHSTDTVYNNNPHCHYISAHCYQTLRSPQYSYCMQFDSKSHPYIFFTSETSIYEYHRYSFVSFSLYAYFIDKDMNLCLTKSGLCCNNRITVTVNIDFSKLASSPFYARYFCRCQYISSLLQMCGDFWVTSCKGRWKEAFLSPRELIQCFLSEPPGKVLKILSQHLRFQIKAWTQNTKLQ